MLTRPVIRIQDINPMLFSFVEELNDVKVNYLPWEIVQLTNCDREPIPRARPGSTLCLYHVCGEL